MRPTSDEGRAALEIAGEAARLIMRDYARARRIPNAPVEITTATDRAAQDLIATGILQRFPGDAIAAEETAAMLRHVPTSGPRLWIVDPIDGTRGFARKTGEFSVMIAFCSAGRLEVGVVHEPAAGRVTWAERGRGCWAIAGEGWSRCRVSRVQVLADAALARSHLEGAPSRVEALLAPRRIVRAYSAGVKLAMVARGEADIYATRGAFHDWDLAAGAILVSEAGGRVTDSRGGPLQFGTPGALQARGVVASNGRLHGAVVAALSRRP